MFSDVFLEMTQGSIGATDMDAITVAYVNGTFEEAGVGR